MPSPLSRPLVVAAGLLAGLATTFAMAPASAASTSDRYESDSAHYTNVERSKHHLKSLKGSSCLDRYAEKQAAAMARSRSMYHQSMQPILRACHLQMVGENVAYGYPSGKSVVGAWMNSPGHRANILNKGYTMRAHGAAKGSNGLWYVSQVFGRPM